jgi:FkbM family methyltransferase
MMRHPLGRINRWRTLNRFLRWQVGSRLVAAPVAVPFVNETRLLVPTGMQGATGNMYVGLLEFEPMGFLLHVLRPQDLLLDVGANVGVYAVLAAGGCGADVIAFEPVSETARNLEVNIRINDLGGSVETRRCVVGRASGSVEVSTDRDTTNRVVDGQRASEDGSIRPTERIRSERLDDVDVIRTDPEARVFLKVDVEGFEVEVLEGAARLLHDPNLLAVIIEINGSGATFGHSDERILEVLAQAGFTEVTYDPIRRSLVERPSPDATRIFVRDVDQVLRRIETASRVRLGIGVDI